MRVRSITTCALGLAAALTVVASPLAAQSQDTTKLRKTTTSSTRIPISKEAPGEVVTVRVDTVYVTRHDTVTTTILRIDTVTVTPPAPIVFAKVKGPMFWGVFAGSTWPMGNIDRLYTNGFHGGGVLGWESQSSLLGFRLDGAVHQIGRELGFSTVQTGSGTPLLMTLAGDLKAKVINVRGWSFYGIGGLNLTRFNRIALATTSKTLGNECDYQVRGSCYENAPTTWKTKAGWNFGAGVDFHIGSQDMFVEGRHFTIRTDGAHSHVMPFSLGVRYF
jgi:hypothetical protein